MAEHEDPVVGLFERTRERRRRGEDPHDLEWETTFAGFTDEERDSYMALWGQASAAGGEQLEALEEDDRILKILLRLDAGLITTLRAVQEIRGALPALD